MLPLLAPLDDIVDLPHQLLGWRRHIEEYAVIIDGVGDVVLYNELEYCYIALPLLYTGETPYHELSVNGIHVGIKYCMHIYMGFLVCTLGVINVYY